MRQEDFAEPFGISRYLIAKIETDNRMPNYRFVRAIKKLHRSEY